jgi:hypothetical protein
MARDRRVKAQTILKKSGILAALCLLILTTGCSTVLYQASGSYEDAASEDREILLQWSAQKYYIPFVNPDVDYGSVSLQAECLADVFLDHKNDREHGFVFVERPNDFSPSEGAPEIRIDDFLVCAKFGGGPSIEELSTADTAKLQILCEPKFPAPFLAPSLTGYSLTIAQGKTLRTLECRRD